MRRLAFNTNPTVADRRCAEMSGVNEDGVALFNSLLVGRPNGSSVDDVLKPANDFALAISNPYVAHGGGFKVVQASRQSTGHALYSTGLYFPGDFCLEFEVVLLSPGVYPEATPIMPTFTTKHRDITNRVHYDIRSGVFRVYASLPNFSYSGGTSAVLFGLKRIERRTSGSIKFTEYDGANWQTKIDWNNIYVTCPFYFYFGYSGTEVPAEFIVRNFKLISGTCLYIGD